MLLSTSGIIQSNQNIITPTLPGDYDFGAYVAYSLRKVVSSYSGPVVRVRRSSDNSEQDFLPDEVSNGTLTTFVGAGDGFVTTLYNQTVTASMNLVQTNLVNQPLIVQSGILYTENTRPSMKFDGTRFLQHATASSWGFLHYLTTSVFSVQKIELANPDTLYAIWATGQGVSGQRVAYLRYDDRSANSYNNDWIHIIGNNGVVAFNQLTPGTGQFESQKLLTARVHSKPSNATLSERSYVGVNSNTLVNNNTSNQPFSPSAPTHGLRLGDANGGWRLVGAISEIIIYYHPSGVLNVQTSDSAIDAEMKAYYNII